jgi:hypothetical protein
MLYRYAYAGIKGYEIGKLMRLDYNIISLGRKRLKGKCS